MSIIAVAVLLLACAVIAAYAVSDEGTVAAEEHHHQHYYPGDEQDELQRAETAKTRLARLFLFMIFGAIICGLVRYFCCCDGGNKTKFFESRLMSLTLFPDLRTNASH
jgi:hypothetical protein